MSEHRFILKVLPADSNYAQLAELHQNTSIHQRAEKLLRVIERRTKQPGEFVEIRAHLDYPLVDATNAEPIYYFLQYWHELGCLDRDLRGSARLTVRGWDRLDPASAGAGIPGRAFVAMSFDPSLNDAYELGIRKAIEEDCNLTAIRVDKEQFKEKICDRILAEIRRSQIVVADFTHHKNGVYFEAGFALALGRLVIWTCREDAIKGAHFDTRQYPHIVWQNEDDLRTKLTDRIQALLHS